MPGAVGAKVTGIEKKTKSLLWTRDPGRMSSFPKGWPTCLQFNESDRREEEEEAFSN